MFMNSIDALIQLADEYGRATGVTVTTVSWRVFNDSKKLSAIKAGADIQVSRFERAVSWFAQNWPEGAVWPEALPRPREAA